jgi:hypothetical protein
MEGLLNQLNAQFHEGTGEGYSQYKNRPVEFIEEVLGEYVPPEVQELLRACEDKENIVGVSATGTGKSWAASRYAIYWYLVYQNEGCQVMVIATPEAQMRRVLFKEISAVVDAHPELFEGHTVKSLHISNGPNAFIEGVTVPAAADDAAIISKLSGIHSPHLCLIYDEADALRSSVFVAGEGNLSGSGGRMLSLFNPKKRSGEIYQMLKDGRAHQVKLTAFGHPNVYEGPNSEGQDRIPGAVNRKITVRRIALWCRPLVEGERPGAEDFLLPAFLEGEIPVMQSGKILPALEPGYYRVIVPQMYTQVLGIYPVRDESLMLSEDDIAKARSRYDQYVAQYGDTPPANTSAMVGFDLAEMGNDKNVVFFRYGNYLSMPKTWSGIQVPDSVDKCAAFLKGKSISTINADGTGVGSAAGRLLARDHNLPSISVKVASKADSTCEYGDFGCLRDELIFAMVLWIKDGGMLPPVHDLMEELLTLSYRVDDLGKVRVVKKSEMKEMLPGGRSSDHMDALYLTMYSHGLFSEMDLT